VVVLLRLLMTFTRTSWFSSYWRAEIDDLLLGDPALGKVSSKTFIFAEAIEGELLSGETEEVISRVPASQIPNHLDEVQILRS